MREYVPGISTRMKLLSLWVYFPCAFVTVFPGQLPVCWFSPVRLLNTVLFPTFGLPARAIILSCGVSFSILRAEPFNTPDPVDALVKPIIIPSPCCNLAI